jgi:hypothetical protein
MSHSVKQSGRRKKAVRRPGRRRTQRRLATEIGEKTENPAILNAGGSPETSDDYDDDSLDLATLKAAEALDAFEMPDEEPLPDEGDFWIEQDDVEKGEK